MAFLIDRRQRTTQPSGPVPVDRQNPLNRALLAAINPAVDRTLNGLPPTVNTGVHRGSASGLGLDFSATTKTQWAHQPVLANGSVSPSGCTVFVLLDVDTLTNYGGIISLQDATTSKVAFEIRLGTLATDSKINVVRAASTAGEYRASDTSANRIAAGDKGVRLAVTFADDQIQTSPIVYVNGVAYSTTGVGGSPAVRTVAAPTTTGLLIGGRSPDAATYLDGAIYFAAIWGRELSEKEIAALTANPWQIYDPVEGLIWMPSAGGAYNVSATLGTAAADGFTASIDRQLAIAATLGTATADGFLAGVDRQLAVSGTLGAASADGFTAAVDRQLAVSGTLGSAAASGFDANVDRQSVIAATLGAATAAGSSAVIDLQYAISATIGAAAASGFTADVDLQTAVDAFLGTAVASGFDASISAGTVVNASLGTASADGFTANIDRQVVVTATLAIATADGLTASIGAGLEVHATVGAAAAAGYTAAIEARYELAALLGTAVASGYTAAISTSTVAAVIAAPRSIRQAAGARRPASLSTSRR